VARSVDASFALIAFQKKLLVQEVLDAEQSAHGTRLGAGETLTLAEHLVERGLVTSEQKAEIERVRARHGRTCSACGAITFLLPGESESRKPCEVCGGALKPAPKPAAAPAKPSAPSQPVAPPKPVPLRTVDLRSLAAAATNPAQVSPAPDAAVAPSEAAPAAPEPRPEPTRAQRSRSARAAGFFADPPPPRATAPEPSADTPPLPPPPDLAPARTVTKTFGPPPEAEPPPPPPRPTHSFTSETGSIVGYPVRGAGLAIVVGAALAGVLLNWFGFVCFLPVGAIAFWLSMWAYQAKVIQSTIAGEDVPPTRPDASETAQLIWPPIVTALTCFFPLMVVTWLGAKAGVTSSDGPRVPKISVGDKQHVQSVGRTTHIGVDASALEFSQDGRTVRVGDRKGRWLVLGYVFGGGAGSHEVADADDDEDDDGETPKKKPANATPTVHPFAQFFDLGRLAKVSEIDVASLSVGRPVHDLRFPELRAWTTPGPLPGALEDATTTPTVWIIDPQGKIRKEFVGGVSDRVLWGTLKNFKKGGPGTTLAENLPGQGAQLLSSGYAVLTLVVLLLGALYYPMAMVMVICGHPGLPFNYALGLRSIRDSLGEYAFVAGITLVVYLGLYVGTIAIILLMVASLLADGFLVYLALGFVVYLVLVYLILVQSRATGRFFVRNQGLFPWAARSA
jgi:hypothetical protein